MAVKNSSKTGGGRFQPGNPGRPKGARNRRTRLAEQLMADDLDDIVRAVTKAAREGDIQAARIVLDRLAPIPRGRRVRFQMMPDTTDNAAGIDAALGSVVEAMAAGHVSTEEAAGAAAVLEARRRSLETRSLEARIVALEAAATTKGTTRTAA